MSSSSASSCASEVVGQLLGKLFLDRAAAVGLRVLHRQRQPAVRGDGKRRPCRAWRHSLTSAISAETSAKIALKSSAIGKPLARLVAVVAVAVVAESRKSRSGSSRRGHIHRVDQLLGEAEFGLDRAAAVRLERRVGDLAHAAAQKERCQHAHCERRSEITFSWCIAPLVNFTDNFTRISARLQAMRPSLQLEKSWKIADFSAQNGRYSFEKLLDFTAMFLYNSRACNLHCRQILAHIEAVWAISPKGGATKNG